MLKPSLYKNSSGISPKVSVIALLEFELAYYDVVVKHVNHLKPYVCKLKK